MRQPLLTCATAIVAIGCTPSQWFPQAIAPLGVRATLGAPTARTNGIVDLGSRLFFDARLSRDGSMSCATCHDPDHAFTESDAVSHGIGPNARRRNTPTILNSAFEESLGWDGRFSTLEAQILGVFTEDGDMGIGIVGALTVVQGDSQYVTAFRQAFGAPPDVPSFLNAIATYERSLVSGNSRLDRYLIGGDSLALSESERRGLEIFIAVGCSGCHQIFQRATLRADGAAVSLLTDHHFHNLGVGYANGRMLDAGQFEVTGRASHFGRFKTPSLRNVALTAPYMHDGSLATLEEVVEFYEHGGVPNPNLDVVIHPREFTPRERSDLVAVLRAMTSEPIVAVQASATARRHTAKHP